MTATDTLQARQRGFSLVELMVAIAIGLFLLAGAITIFTTSKRTYLEQNDMARIQEGLRFANDMITRDLRLAGYVGCAYGINPARLTVEPALAAAATLFDLTRGPIQGNEGGAGAPWLPTPTGGAVENMTNPMPLTADNEAISPVAGSDAITIRHAGGSKWEVTAAMGAATDDVAVNNTASNYCLDETGAVVSCNAAAAVVVLGGSGQTIATNDVVAIASCSAVDVFRASGATGAALSHAAALSGTYGTDAVVSRGTLVRYFVGTDPAGEPGLYREEPNPGGVNLTRSTLLIPGVENMQIQYGIDTLPAGAPDGVADDYVAAGDADLDDDTAEWASVVSVRIGLLVRSLADNSATALLDIKTYPLLGTDIDPVDDHRKRRTVETMLLLRNSFTPENFGG